MFRKGAVQDRQRYNAPIIQMLSLSLILSGCSGFQHRRALKRGGLISYRPIQATRNIATIPFPQAGVETSGETPSAVLHVAEASNGSVTVAGTGFAPVDVDIPAKGLNLGQALQLLRQPETMALRLPGITSEDELAVKFTRDNVSVYQPLFIAEHTDSRLMPLKDGDRIRVSGWQDSPLLNDKVTNYSRNSTNELIGLEKDLPSQILAYQSVLDNPTSTPEGKSEAEIGLGKAKVNLIDVKKELSYRSKQSSRNIAYTITGLVANPGPKTINTSTGDQDINSITGVAGAAQSKGQAANVIAVTRSTGDHSSQFILPFGETIDGVKVPIGLQEEIANVRNEGRILDGDVYQFNQLQFLPTVLAGTMAQQIQQQMDARNAQVQQQNRNAMTNSVDRIVREPSALATSFRRLRERVPRLTAGARPVLR